MRVPKSPEPSTLRQVEPEIQKGEFETRVNPEAFGGVSESNINKEEQTASLGLNVQEQADKYLYAKGMADYKNKMSSIIPPIVGAKGEDAQQYNPDNADGPYKQKVDPAIKEVMESQGIKENERVQALLRVGIEKDQSVTKKDVQTNIVRQTYYANIANHDSIITRLQKDIPSYQSDGSFKFHRDQLDETVAKRLAIQGKQSSTEDQVEAFNQSYDNQVIKYLNSQGNVQGARDYAKQVESWGGVVSTSAQKEIFQTGTRMDAENWYSLASKKLKDADGRPDLKGMENSVDGMNLNQAQKDIYLGVIRMKFGMDSKADIQAHKNSWTLYKDEMTKASKNFTIPISTQDAYNAATKYGTGPEDYHALAKWTESQYAKDGGFGSPALQTKHYTDLREQVAFGNIGSLKALESLQGTVTPKQFTQLKTEWFKTMEGGPDTQKNTVLRRIRAMGTDVYGTDQTGMNNYMNTMLDKYHQLGTGGDANQVLSDAKEYLKGDAPKASDIWKGDFADKAGNMPSDMLRSFYTDYGKEVTDGIGEELRKSLGRVPTPLDFSDFINSVGGQDAIKRFTPTNNAMLSILRWNEDHPQYKPMDLNKENIEKWVNTYGESGGVH